MVIDRFFIHYKPSTQYIYWGENGVDVYKRSDSGKNLKKSNTFANVSLTDITSDEFAAIARELQSVDTGVVLNSSQFIFNIFEFEKIPFQEGLKRDLVEWRLKKVFPENIDDYAHDYFKLSKDRILSILFKKSLKEKIENLFAENGVQVIYMGNSTVEIMNHLTGKKSLAPDFFIEIDKGLSMAVFLDRGVPYYIRKFRSDRAAGIAGELVKTVNFVKNSYAKVPRRYSIAADPADVDLQVIKDELSIQALQPLNMENKVPMFLPREKYM
jgi:hypothetical protein